MPANVIKHRPISCFSLLFMPFSEKKKPLAFGQLVKEPNQP